MKTLKNQPNNLEEIKLFCEKHNLTLKQLIDGELIGGSLDLHSVTSIPDNVTFNVGGSLDLHSVTSKSNYKRKYFKENEIFICKNKRYIKADGIMCEVLKNKGQVYHIRIFGSTKETFLVTDGKNFSHGETLQEAKEDLVYKLQIEKKMTTKIIL